MNVQELKELLQLSSPEAVERVYGQLKPIAEAPGWALIKLMWEQQLENRKATVILQPLGETPNAVYVQEYMKGEIAGIRVALELVGAVYSLTQELMKEYQQQAEPKREDEDDYSDNDSADDGK